MPTVGTGSQVYANYLTFTQIQTVGAHGIVVTPGDLVGGPLVGYEVFDTPNLVSEAWAPWGMFLRMQDCICRKDGDGNPAPGRFADNYKRIIGCWMCGSEP